ncbi:DUF2268 domain-containing protein [Butyrivibrio fibrisolvens]|nr:DUF2268 domain-containing protein [Pseudobutyrivibrio ruminis]MDC7280256.1 DUF2268 domain-containing protein [Butyrivibrio fibrisolvens]
MKVNRLYSPDIYRKIMLADQDKKDDIYRYDMMMPFKGKWDIYHIPMTPKYPGGYDIIMANRMFGLASPSDIDGSYENQINSLANDEMWTACQDSIEKALLRFYDNGIDLKTEEYTYSILLADPKSPYTIMNDGYCGDGGIPGFIMGWLIPTEENIKRLPVALAHETNHNVRYQFIKWTNDVNVAEMIVSEGLAENYATTIFGEEYLGPWVTKTDMELMPLIKEIIHDGLEVTGFDNITSYLYGDEMAEMRQFPKVGLPYCAGYATGYYLVKYYLEKTGMPIEKATILPADEILKEVPEFWEM